MYPFTDIKAAEIAPVCVADTRAKSTVSVVGLGDVGAVIMACLSSLGHYVIGVDKNPDALLRVSQAHNTGLGRRLNRGLDHTLIRTTDDIAYAVRESHVTCITPTLTQPDAQDPDTIETIARSIGVGLAQKTGFHTVALNAPIAAHPMADRIAGILETISGKASGVDFDVTVHTDPLCALTGPARPSANRLN